MSIRKWNDLWTVKPNRVMLTGSAQFAGAADLTDAKGDVLQVTRSGVGTYTAFLDGVFSALESLGAELQLVNTLDYQVIPGVVTLVDATAPGKTKVVIAVLNGAGAAVDPASSAANRLHITAVFRNSSR